MYQFPSSKDLQQFFIFNLNLDLLKRMEPIITVYKNQTKMNKGLTKSKIVTKIKPQKVVLNKVLIKTKIKKIEAQILTIINHKEKISNKKILILKVMTKTMMNNKEAEKI